MKFAKYSLGLFVSAALVCPVAAQNADRPIRIIVPFGAGSSVDATARPFAQSLSELASRSVIVENRPGAEGLIGANAVINAKPDGLTLMLTSNSVPTLLTTLRKEPPFDVNKDLMPICTVSMAPMNVFTRAGLPFKSLGEFVVDARKHPNKYTFAYASGLGRLGGELLIQHTDTKLLGVGYKTTAQAVTGLAAGEVDLMIVDLSSANAQYQAGKIRPLLVADKKRSPSLPDIPSASEAGVDGYNVSVWFGIYVPRDTPADLVANLERMTRSAAESELVKDANAAGGRSEMVLCGDEMRAYQNREIQNWQEAIRKAQIELS